MSLNFNLIQIFLDLLTFREINFKHVVNEIEQELLEIVKSDFKPNQETNLELFYLFLEKIRDPFF